MSARDPFRYFRLEARELLDALSDAIDVLSRDADPKPHRTMMRHAHTLKGAARVVGLGAIGESAHELESLLEGRASQLLTDAERGAAIGKLRDMRQRLAALPSPAEAGGAESGGAEAGRATDGASGASSDEAGVADAGAGSRPDVRAGVASEPTEPEGAGSISPIAGADSVRVELARLRRLGAQLEDAWAAARALRDELGALQIASGDVQRAAGSGKRRLTSAERGVAGRLAHLERDLRVLSSEATDLAQVECSEIFAEVGRAARDAGAVLGRPVSLLSSGGAVRVDPQIASTLRLALLHAARNAVAHGFEAPEVRAAAGKPAVGTLTVDVVAQGSGVRVTVADDGGGIDEARVREALEASGRADVASLDGHALHRALLGAEVSTRTTVDAIAGRGVGLGAITSAVASLRGEVSLSSNPGKGTQLTIELPVSLSSLPVLHLEDHGRRAVLPLHAVRASLRLEPGDVSRTERHHAISFESELVPMVTLRQVLGVSPQHGRADRASRAAVIVEHEGSTVALGVDRCLGIAPARVRPVPAVARPLAIVAGAAVAGRGAPGLLLSPAALVKARASLSPTPPTKPRRRRKILLVDDSLTTRMLEEAILVGAGYEVAAAESAEAGLERAGRERFDLFVVDVDMPGMDGFAFVRLTRADATLRETPAVMVTSRARAEDRERAAAAGAAGYMVKGDFEQRVFLDLVARLTETS